VSKFKVGDRVKLIPPASATATVVAYEPPGKFDYKIRMDNGVLGLVWEYEIELVSTRKPTVTRAPSMYVVSVNDGTMTLSEEEAKRLHKELADLFLP
jgi:hypothetical protein